MKKSLLAVACCTLLAAPAVMAEHKSHIDVSYLGSVSYDSGDGPDVSINLQGLKGGFYVPMTKYFFWSGSADYGSDSDVEGVKVELTTAKVAGGGRLPLGDMFAARAYLGYLNAEINGTGVVDGSGAMGGIALDFSPLEALDVEVLAEFSNAGDIKFSEAGINGFWSFSPAIAVGLGYKYRNYQVQLDPGEADNKFGYVEAGLRISF
ncbi:outer membrane beta-barrel protein [Simiduia agarivorans]|uniref:Outer membrane protein beta-barrel domain-containing protein n=1 Tax=Simiduia agarivorans (strain DSM 21679 / JCM 13881 / BCRC 17597 / SA1) TaxID=1117647 RepID=K4KQE5_SIMAS|nr:outer membrane beta-barrel protein [Simiduia agarivorans]AFV00339.1 hypothetical protein M5M_16030 [Simiduia agarivorans SA1 = DSM 21679]